MRREPTTSLAWYGSTIPPFWFASVGTGNGASSLESGKARGLNYYLIFTLLAFSAFSSDFPIIRELMNELYLNGQKRVKNILGIRPGASLDRKNFGEMTL